MISQMHLQCPNFSECDNQTDDNCEAYTYTRTWMSNMNVEENETGAALVSVLSKMDNRVNLSRKTPEEGEGLMLVTM